MVAYEWWSGNRFLTLFFPNHSSSPARMRCSGWGGGCVCVGGRGVSGEQTECARVGPKSGRSLRAGGAISHRPEGAPVGSIRPTMLHWNSGKLHVRDGRQRKGGFFRIRLADGCQSRETSVPESTAILGTAGYRITNREKPSPTGIACTREDASWYGRVHRARGLALLLWARLYARRSWKGRFLSRATENRPAFCECVVCTNKYTTASAGPLGIILNRIIIQLIAYKVHRYKFTDNVSYL